MFKNLAVFVAASLCAMQAQGTPVYSRSPQPLRITPGLPGYP